MINPQDAVADSIQQTSYQLDILMSSFDLLYGSDLDTSALGAAIDALMFAKDKLQEQKVLFDSVSQENLKKLLST